MRSAVVVQKIVIDSRADELLSELGRRAETFAVVERTAGELRLIFEGHEYAEARRMVEDALAVANPAWPDHVRIERP